MTAFVLFGGSFDPPHQGHLELADLAVQALGVDTIHFVPARVNPLKEGVDAAAEHRLALLHLLLEDRHQVLDWELEREGPSYTIDTVRRAVAESGQRPTWLLGADCLDSLHLWHDIATLFDEAHLQLVARAGSDLVLPESLVKAVGLEIATLLLETALTLVPMDVSSTGIRSDISVGKMPQGLTEPMVAYIQENGLYGHPRVK